MSYIVVFDDEQGAFWPMGWDTSCDGALSTMTDMTVALFADKAAARKAIRISAAYAKLRHAQGLPENTDFTDGAKCLKLVKILPKEPPCK